MVQAGNFQLELARDRGVLEFVDLGVAHQEVKHPVDRRRSKLPVTIGTSHHTHKRCLIARDERRDTESRVLLYRSLVFGANRFERPSALDLAKDKIGVDANPGECIADNCLVAKIISIIVSNGEKRKMGIQEPLGKAITHDNPCGKCNEVRAMVGVVKRGQLTRRHMGLR